MRIQGLQKLTLLDYPGKTACTVFFLPIYKEFFHL